MTEAGDIYLADLNEERRRRVLVVSNARFNRLAGRVIVAPEVTAEPDEVQFPWRIECDAEVFATDLLRSVPVERLLERVSRAPYAVMTRTRRAIAHII